MTTDRRLRELLRVPSEVPFRLAEADPSDTHGRTRAGAEVALADGLARLHDLQERIFAEQRHKVLVVLQGIDAAGKGGTIEHVMGAFNPAGCPVTSFKVPSEEERAHDYLWRIHRRSPGTGEIAIFDRSHYEDVLIVRVHDLVSRDVWSRRYDHINAWEQMLAEEGTTILKFFLYIDRDEQRERFQARYDDPTKRWKFRVGDLEERARWDDYIAAFEEAISRCSTSWAPWYVIPSNRKWFRNLAVAEILGDALDALNPQYPVREDLPDGLVIP